jgi:hypothetical protein
MDVFVPPHKDKVINILIYKPNILHKYVFLCHHTKIRNKHLQI